MQSISERFEHIRKSANTPLRYALRKTLLRYSIHFLAAANGSQIYSRANLDTLFKL